MTEAVLIFAFLVWLTHLESDTMYFTAISALFAFTLIGGIAL